MTYTSYVPIYRWNDSNPDVVHGIAFGTTHYDDLNELFAFEPDAVGYFEMHGEIPTENEFKRTHGLSGGRMKDVKSYLKKMTEIALEHGIIIAEDVKVFPSGFDPFFKTPKLYWDSGSREYVFADENGITRPE